jgi:hypothetical protein
LKVVLILFYGSESQQAFTSKYVQLCMKQNAGLGFPKPTGGCTGV